MKTIKTSVYKFDELNEAAKQKAIELNRDINTNHDWYHYTVDNFKDETKLFDVTNVYFSGFWSQGDGAMFEYDNISDTLINEAIDNLILDDWKKNVLKKCIYVSCDAKQSGRYYHEKSVNHNIWIENNYANGLYPNIDDLIECYSIDIEAHIIDKYEEICNELYHELEKEYEYYTSDEAIAETLLINDFDFIETGEIY